MVNADIIINILLMANAERLRERRLERISPDALAHQP